MHSAPLWLRKPTFPGRAIWAAKVAFSPCRAHDAQAVRADKPHPPRRACSRSPLELGPAGPISLNPAEMMIAPLTPRDTFADHAGTVGAGVTTTARSTGSGTSPMWVSAIPRTLGRLGLTG